MSWRLALLSAVVSLACFGLAMWPFGLSAGRAALLTPLFVLTGGVAVALVMIWTKVVLEELRGRRR